MRSPKCHKELKAALCSKGLREDQCQGHPYVLFGNGVAGQKPTRILEEEISCCRGRAIVAQNVDIYYWPEQDVDDSCLETVGSNVSNLDHGATTGLVSLGPYDSFIGTWWGCTIGTPTTRILNYVTYTTTASITTINSHTFKVPLHNPWFPIVCIDSASLAIGSSKVVTRSNSMGSMY